MTRIFAAQPVLLVEIKLLAAAPLARLKFAVPSWHRVQLLLKMGCMSAASVLATLATPNTAEASTVPPADLTERVA